MPRQVDLLNEGWGDHPDRDHPKSENEELGVYTPLGFYTPPGFYALLSFYTPHGFYAPLGFYTPLGFYAPLGFYTPLGFYAPLGFCTPLGFYAPLGFSTPLGFYAPLGFYTPLGFYAPLGVYAPLHSTYFDMERDLVTTREKCISMDKLAKYKGSAQVSIAYLGFPHPCRQIDRKVIERLKRDFEGEGCIKDKQTHRIPAIIEDSVLQVGLEKLAISPATFKATSGRDPPQLYLGHDVKLECLHGQHRILAAKEFLPASKRWWIVDLYGTDLESDTKQAFREGYSYSAPYSSGEIFRYIRLCHFDNDASGEQRWRAWLSPYQEKYLKIILARRVLIEALDSVLHIQGLWRSFYIGSLNDLISLGCDEEIAHYILFIKLMFTRIFGDDMVTAMSTDPFSIESIQSRAPALSKSDFDFIQDHMRDLFPAVTDPARRAIISERLLATEELIPSLWTLISDIRYLKQPAKTLNTLLPPNPRKRGKETKNSLRERFRFHYNMVESSGDTVEVQQSTTAYTTFPKRHLDSFDIAYQQLWLCSYRISRNLNPYGLLQLATLAHRLGFSNAEILRELKVDPGHAVVEKTVLEALKVLRPNEAFVFDAHQARPVITSWEGFLDKTLSAPVKAVSPLITVTGSGEPLARRSGYGCMDVKDLNHLFLDKIHAPLQAYQSGGDEISSFYVKRSRHIAFFGAVSLVEAQGEQSSHLSLPGPPRDQQVLVPVVSFVDRVVPDVVPDEQVINSDTSSLQIARSQVLPFAGLIVTFVESGLAVQEVLYEKQRVNDQAQKYADQGKNLSVMDGPHFVWQDCFDILIRTGKSTVLVSSVV